MVEIINFNGEDNIVIQSSNINGNLFEQQKSFQDFVSPFSVSYQMQIEDLQNTIEDKKRTNGLINKEVIELYIKKEALENKKTNKEKHIAHLLKNLDGKDLSNSTSLYEQAFNYFIDGDIDSALSVLDDAKIEEEKNNTKQQAETRILKARLLRIKNEFVEASKNYEIGFELCKDWKLLSLEIASYFSLFDTEKAKHYYKISLKDAKNDYEKIKSLGDLATLLIAENNFKDVDKHLNEALQLSEKLKNNSDIDLSNFAMVLNNIGNLLFEKNEFLKAEKIYLKTLEIRTQLANSKPEDYLPQVAVTAGNLGLLKMDQKDFKNSRIYLNKALKIREDIVELNPEKNLLGVAEIQRNIALLEQEDGNSSKAEEQYLKSIETFKKQSPAQQEIHKSFLAGFFNNIGNLQNNNEDIIKAESSFNSALNIIRELAKKNPNKYMPDVAATLHNLGNNSCKKKKYIEAEEHFKEALDILIEFADLIPEKFETNLAKTHMCLGNLYGYDRLNNEQFFKKHILKSIKLYEKYADENPEAKEWLKVATNILAEWKKKWLENFDKIIDETFDEYDEVFKALA